MSLSRVANEIKPHPLTNEAYSNQRILLTLTASSKTMSLIGNV